MAKIVQELNGLERAVEDKTDEMITSFDGNTPSFVGINWLNVYILYN